SPSSSETAPARLYPSTASIVYTLLKPHFAPVRSKISCYSLSDYLDPTNWTYAPSSATSAAATLLPHLTNFVALPALNPGDIVYRHAALPVSSAPEQGQLFLPVSPLPRTRANLEYVQRQREAFENGLPPPFARGGSELVRVEEKGDKSMIGSGGGRRAMGY
ncbi:hypothetical protein P7C73_g6378, partial [Tremellales sp. Uapishka_1]